MRTKPSNEEITKFSNEIYHKLSRWGPIRKMLKKLFKNHSIVDFLISMRFLLMRLDLGCTKFLLTNGTICVEEETVIKSLNLTNIT